MSYCRKTHQFFSAKDGIKALNEKGELRLYSPYAEFLYCMDCGQRMVIESVHNEYFKDNDGNILCPECRDNYFLCDECGTYHHIDEEVIYDTVVGTQVSLCDECKDKYEKCETCGKYDRVECLSMDINEEYICDDCISATCEVCGRAIPRGYDYTHTQDGYDVCNGCTDDNVAYCESCGQAYLYTSNMIFEDSDENYYCEQCYKRLFTIHSYGYKPEPNILSKYNDEELFGLEIEVCGDRDCASNFLKRFNGEVYLKSDSSIGEGFEIVSHPMDRAYIYEDFYPKLDRGMHYLQDMHFRAHNRAGIHIHVSRTAITNEMLIKMHEIMYHREDTKAFDTWLQITQRTKKQIRDWCDIRLPINNDCYSTIKNKKLKEIKRELELCEEYNQKPKINGERYVGINMHNDYTIEFRIFNSNTRTERIMKNIEVIFSLIDYTKTNGRPTVNSYLSFVMNNKDKYKYFYNFLIEKRIRKTKEQTKMINKLIKASNVNDENELIQLIQDLNIITQNRNEEEECA